MVYFPPAKINLGLQVLRRRPDGYHDISTCMYPIDWTDVLEIVESDQFFFTSTGHAIPGNPDENLCVKAYKLLRKDHDLPPVHIHLHKIIPMGAGLGGGSSDAAWVLKGLNDIFELKLTRQALHNYASELGSDCAFFIYNQPMMASGRGEQLVPIDLRVNAQIIVIYPSIHVNTADAYKSLTPEEGREDISILLKSDSTKWKNVLHNDFEATVFQKHHKIRSIKERLYELGADYAAMSGSGSAVFGIFKKTNNNIAAEFPDCIVHITQPLP